MSFQQKYMTKRVFLACYLVSAFLYQVTQAQPVECVIDDESDGVNQCESGYYCVPEKYVCRKCIDCEELKRETRVGAPICIQSVANCGSCLKGLIPDLGTGIECVSPDSATQDGLPAYVWAAVVVGLILFLLVVFIVVYVLRNTYTFKILASTRTSVQSPCNRNTNGASAPEAPPPYNALYTPVRPSSPPGDVAPNNEPWSYVKRAGSTRIGTEGRESAGSQAARVFSNPNYVRGAHIPDLPSYDAASEEERDVLPHSEDTMESTWTPAADDNHNPVSVSSGGGELSTLLSAARNTSLLRAPHNATQHCASQDTNNNRSAGDGLGAAESAPSSSGPSFIINVVQNINALQQQNDVTL
ncbi:unnamed protein product [Leptosia nina]|uniref:TNFR-Cys domain-containing protein n=1 Tax=Leptosia nina TaxID=320188 RepID=A0AAV1JQV7_9NEOP